MRKNRSFVKEMLIGLSALIGVLIAVLLIVIGASYSILEDEIKASSEGFLQIYSSELNNSIQKMDGILRNVTAQKEDLYKIQADDEKDRSLSAVALQQYMAGMLQEDSEADAIVLYDGAYEVCLDAVKANMRYEQKILLRDYARTVLGDEAVSSFAWTFIELEESSYLCKVLKNGKRTIMICVDTKNLLSMLAEQELWMRTLVLTDEERNPGRIWGDAEVLNANASSYFVQQTTVLADQLKLYCYTGKQSVFSQIGTGTAVVAVSVLLVVLFVLFLRQYARKEIMDPMSEIIRDLEIIKRGDYERRVEGSYRAREFQVLKATINQMVDEIVGLKIQAYEKKLSLQDVELKSIRLQLKPHFFLNALNTISSLSAQEKYEEIRAYISALSRNVRYMFRAGFHTVAIEEELRHVEHYLEMQEMKYPDCVFYLCELPEACRGWRVPQMLIHTFVENIYKHAVIIGETLTLLIKIRIEKYKGVQMLLIEIEDDGKGYPQDVLDYMNARKERSTEPGKRVGLWSVKRMVELMYEREDLVELSNIEPHGCLNRLRIPQRPVQELPEEGVVRERGSDMYA